MKPEKEVRRHIENDDMDATEWQPEPVKAPSTDAAGKQTDDDTSHF